MPDERFFFRLTVVTFSVLVVSLLPQSQTTIGEIKNSIICLCGCNMTVEACEGSMACQSAANLAGEARSLIDKGLDKEEVLASFVTNYGEHILAAPTKRGFNLTAWILPFAAIILAGIGIIIVLRRWVRLSKGEGVGLKATELKAGDPRYEEKLKEVLRALD